VLVVDPTEETREVLRAVLEERGLQTFGASRAEEALDMARAHTPDLIVLDLEADASPDEQWAGAVARQSRTSDRPLLVLGRVRNRSSLAQVAQVAKPYHYAPLLRRIEAMLDEGLQPALVSAGNRT
jgi:DNA-binding response OmpR family regulator